MSKVKCVRKNVIDFEQVVEGYIAKVLYDYNYKVIGYEVKYKADRGCIICLEKDFDIMEL